MKNAKDKIREQIKDREAALHAVTQRLSELEAKRDGIRKQIAKLKTEL